MLVIKKRGVKTQVDMNVEEAYKSEILMKQGWYHLGCWYNINDCFSFTVYIYINISARTGPEGSDTELQNG